LTDADAGSQFGVAVALSGSTMEFVIGGQCAYSSPLLFLPLQRAAHDARLPFARCHVAPRARKITQRKITHT
jgi:hypothetical protein